MVSNMGAAVFSSSRRKERASGGQGCAVQYLTEHAVDFRGCTSYVLGLLGLESVT